MNLRKIILESIKEMTKNSNHITNIEIRNHIFEKYKLVIKPNSVRNVLIKLNYQGVAVPIKMSEVDEKVKKELEDKLKKVFGKKWRKYIFERMIVWKIDVNKFAEWLDKHGDKY